MPPFPSSSSSPNQTQIPITRENEKEEISPPTPRHHQRQQRQRLQIAAAAVLIAITCCFAIFSFCCCCCCCVGNDDDDKNNDKSKSCLGGCGAAVLVFLESVLGRAGGGGMRTLSSDWGGYVDGGSGSDRSRSGGGREFKWEDIPPSPNLTFHPCPSHTSTNTRFQCARLLLPLDPFNTNTNTSSSTITLAIAKLPARVPITSPHYGGPVLLNPGGPGGPGVLFALGVGEQVQEIVDSGVDPSAAMQDGEKEEEEEEEAKYFDIIGFDPRGVGETQPGAVCIPDAAAAWSWGLREEVEGILGSSDAALGRLWGREHAFGAACRDEGEGDIKRYVTTGYVARDMLEIVERHAELVAGERVRLSGVEKEEDRYVPGEAMLQYWGFSYGTYLGATFASMFPNRIARLALDGVVSSWDYNHALGNGSLHDTEKVRSLFNYYCVNTGPSNCPLSTPNSTPADIEARVNSILEGLYHNPMILPGPEIITWSDVKKIMFSVLYLPSGGFPQIAHLLAAVEAGSGPILDQLAAAFRYAHVYHCPSSSPDTTSPPPIWYTTPQTAILCSDGIDQSFLNITAFTQYWKLIESISPSAAGVWGILKMRCAGWGIRPAWRFDEEFGAGDTSHPILFLSNTADPVTPLRSGRYMKEKFGGAGLVIQDSAGHCTRSTPTPCTLRHLRNYFQTGALPNNNSTTKETLCIPPPSALSLNSTDPDSPFYDHELGNAVVDDAEAYAGNQKLFRAAERLRDWTAENPSMLGFGIEGERAQRMVAKGMEFMTALDKREE